MALYVLKENEQDLLQMNFEQILSFITENPKQLLSGKGITPGEYPDDIIYCLIKKSTEKMSNLDYTLEKLE
jgi:hypothetical protein